MRLPNPRIVVIDDQIEDLRAIVDGLAALGTTALAVHYPESSEPPDCPCMRILFLDLHLIAGPADTDQQIKTTVGILITLLKPEHGPYLVVLWTKHPSDRELFEQRVKERLPPERVPLPLGIVALDKTEFIGGDGDRRAVRNPQELRQRIKERVEECPQLAAILSWEEDVARAVDETIRGLNQIARRKTEQQTDADLPRELGQTLAQLAIAAIGKENARQNVHRGVNEVLSGVLADRLMHLSAGTGTNELWATAAAFAQTGPALTNEEEATLNRFLNVEDGDLVAGVPPWERGIVSSLSSLDADITRTLWGVSNADLLTEFCLGQSQTDGGVSFSVEWIMVQVQGACDHAQQNRGLPPYILGARTVGLSANRREKIRKMPALWLSPSLLGIDQRFYSLVFHLRFVTGLSRERIEQLGLPAQLRLKDQILADLTHRKDTYAGRPGFIQFSGS
jgi:hypothetical protein